MNIILENMTDLKSEIKIGNQTCGIQIERHTHYMQANFWFYCAYDDADFERMVADSVEKAVQCIPISVQPIQAHDSINEIFQTITNDIAEYAEKLSKKIPSDAKYIRFDLVEDVFNDALDLNKARFGHVCNLNGVMQVLKFENLTFSTPLPIADHTYFIPLDETTSDIVWKLKLNPAHTAIESIDVILIESGSPFVIQSTPSYILATINEVFKSEQNFKIFKNLIDSKEASAALN